MEKIVEGILSKVGEYLLELTIKQGRYLFCFNNIVQDLKEEETNLKFANDNVKKDVEIAERNTENVKEDVSKWLTDASTVLADVQRLKEEIDLNKTCHNGWCRNWCCRYRLSKKAAKKTNMMLKLRDSGKFNSVAHPTTLQVASGFLAPKDFEPFQSSKVAFDQIIEALKNDQTNLVGLYGMGGAGKTTLANAVGVKVKQEKMFDEVVMVVVSQTPNFKNMQGVLAEKLGLKLEEKTEEGRADRLYLRFTKTKEKILVILDDVWENFNLKSKIGFPFDEDHKGCKILVTTRKYYICTAMGCQSRILLDLLNEDEALTLLKRHAGIDVDSPTLSALAIEVAKECNGLPLAIVTIGSALKEKGVDEWKLVYQKLKESKLVDIEDVVDVDKDVYAILKFSYDFLKGEKIKFCFLLCSLFPEDYEIPLEELVRYGMGLDLFPDAESIEGARSVLRGMVNKLKAYFLLLDADDEEHVKMHDMVRDVALWIATQGKNIFMVKAGMRLTEWPNEKSLEHCTAISLMGDNKNVLPNRLFCPALEILILEGAIHEMKVSDQFFEEVRGLKVLNLRYCDLSLKSIQLLINLKTLKLTACNLSDLSFLVKLNKLEILSFRGSYFNELPREVGELSKLRLLDLDGCSQLERIPSNVIRRCSQLEEIYIGTSFTNWEVKETSADQKSNASLFELTSLSCLVKLLLRIDTTCLPKDFTFRNLERYVICMNTDCVGSYTRALAISKIEAISLIAFRSLYQNVEYFNLNETTGCENIFPSIDQGGLNELKSLELSRCSDLKFIIDTSQQYLPANALSNLETFNVSECHNLCTLFPTVLLLRLLKLKQVKISLCDQLQEAFQFQLEGLCYSGKENDLELLPSLSKLKLWSLPKLSYIWKGPTRHVNLKTLTYLHIGSCKILEQILPISIAQGLVELEELIIEDAPQLKQVFHLDREEEEIVAERDEKSVVLPKLRKLTLDTLPSLASFLPKQYHSTCMSLEVLEILRCPSLTDSLISEIKIQDLKEKLRVLEIENCHHELCDGLMLTCLRHDFKNLEELRIKDCVVKVVFPNSKELYIEDCGELEQIIVEEDHMQPLSFPNLSRINVKRCNKLKHLFAITIARGLQQLEDLFPNLKELSVKDCGELEQIIVEEDHMQPLSLPNLSRINVKRCNKLKHLFPITIAQSLQKLQDINLEDCGELEQIIVEEDHMQPLSLPNLSRINVKRCNKLKHLFPITIAQSLQKLQDINLEDCEELEQIIVEEDHMQPLSLPNLSGIIVKRCHKLKHLFPITIAQSLQKLQDINLEDCGELEQIIVKEDHMQPLSFPNLSIIEVKRCNKLKYLFPVTVAQSLQNLQYITLVDNSQSEVIYGPKDVVYVMDDKELVLPELEELSLKALPSFSNICPSGYNFILKLHTLCIEDFQEDDPIWDGIFTHLRDVKFLYIEDCGVKELGGGLWKDPTHTLSLQNLTLLEFYNCNQLRHIFSSTSVAQNLSKLEGLCVWDCGELEKIIVEEDDIQPLLFPNLTKIDVRRCKKLKRVFPITIARGLQQLQHLCVEENIELEEVFGERDGGKVMEMDDKAITLPQLEYLSMQYLPRLSNFCPVGYHFIFPSIKNLSFSVRECGKIATRFWLDENESVHAEAKPPKEGAKDDKHAQLPPHHPPLDIYWHWSHGLDSLRAKLPPYVEKINEEQGITPSSRRQ